MYCEACGAPNPEGARFCGKCGAPQTGGAAPGGGAPALSVPTIGQQPPWAIIIGTA